MRIPVKRVFSKASQEDNPLHELAEAISKRYDVKRDTQVAPGLIAGIAIPKHKIIVEMQEKQNDKAIMAEMAREKIAREAGWSICRLNAEDAKNDPLYRIDREIQRKRAL